MRHQPFVLFTIILLTIFAIQCGQSSGPTSPGMPAMSQAGDATLSGSVTASGANPVDFSQVDIGVKGTTLETQPDQNGNFHLAGLPSGDITVEVNVQNIVSDLALDDVQSREEIKAQIEINDANEAQWCHMERNRKAASTLQLEIRPQKWNVDWVNSPDEETVCFRIYGDGFKDIDPTSIVITCDETGEIVDSDDFENYEIGGVYFKIFIKQNIAIGLVPDAVRGEDYNFSVELDVNDAPIEDALPGSISIVGQKPDDGLMPYEMKISPNKWNTSWDNSSGQVTVQIKGEEFDKILPDSFTMTCVESSVILSDAFRCSITGNHFTAKFSKQDALILIGDLKPGMTCDILVEADVDGGDPFSKTCTIMILGKKEKD